MVPSNAYALNAGNPEMTRIYSRSLRQLPINYSFCRIVDGIVEYRFVQRTS
ncbi:uncharacterized protein MYCFIDRAFT_177722 [Pseudocercospora fijiensis CIRAD86]|uniref:Uncharacterized protein n=1 Tax=Pseudocercospora fijiensis (strain CIRAD86) TaxID=383855 RepID=M3A320_PSEFD|nr:uncharacterized protein MYCFIDRAFT_177722 [Pseudocercospora fijiensis CIRAD86]EME79051.1 hypothetical protein MYCFIDRAFT_177722 [Pseudocercospora fijiensis CIRAD86]